MRRWMKTQMQRLLGEQTADAWLGDAAAQRWRGRWTEIEAWIRRITLDKRFERVIIGLIMLNAVVLGLETLPGVVARYGAIISALDELILAAFTVEIAMRIVTHRAAFFRSGWSWFDLFVVGVSYAPAFSGLSALRVFRIFRLFRLYSIVPKMRRVIDGFFAALPGMSGVVAVLALIFYVSAVITTKMFGQAVVTELPPGASPQDLETVRDLYGSLGRSFFTLFQLMTLEDWADGIVKPTVAVFPNAMLFFIPYIVVTSFAVLNLFIGIIVDAMQDDRDQEEQEVRDQERAARDAREAEQALEADRVRRHDRAQEDRRFDELMQEVRSLRSEIAALSEAQGREPFSRR